MNKVAFEFNDFCLLKPEKPWLVPIIQMKIPKHIYARHPTSVLKIRSNGHLTNYSKELFI